MTKKFKINQNFNESVIAPLIPISFDNSIEYNYGEFSQNDLEGSFVKKQGRSEKSASPKTSTKKQV